MTMPEQTITLDELPRREDYMAVIQAASWPCECPPLLSRLFADMFAPYFDRKVCRGCRARRALTKIVEISEALGSPADHGGADEE